MKWTFATLALTLSLSVSADQMVINGNAIRDGDSVAKLIRELGQPLTKSYRSGCLNRNCTTYARLQRWVYIHDDIEYTVEILGDKIHAIDWTHAH